MKQSSDSPAKAEESQVEAKQSGHHMSNEGTGLTGVEVDPKPHSHQQGEQLTGHKVNLHRGDTQKRCYGRVKSGRIQKDWELEMGQVLELERY